MLYPDLTERRRRQNIWDQRGTEEWAQWCSGLNTKAEEIRHKYKVESKEMDSLVCVVKEKARTMGTVNNEKWEDWDMKNMKEYLEFEMKHKKKLWDSVWDGELDLFLIKHGAQKDRKRMQALWLLHPDRVSTLQPPDNQQGLQGRHLELVSFTHHTLEWWPNGEDESHL